MVNPLRPTHLRCEYLVNPLGIDVLRPRLSWVLEANGRGRRQTAYRITVASRQRLLHADQADLWDSGRVVSAQTTQIDYQGAPLLSGQRCWWLAQVWDEQGVMTTSEVAWWEMGLLEPTDWVGRWISLPYATTDILQPSPYLRRRFQISQPVERARLYATAAGVYELSLNGQRVGDAILTPGWTDYHIRFQYQTYDVKPLLKAGDNTLGAMLGTGWYAGYVGYEGKGQFYGQHLALLAQLHLTYTDGTTEVIATDTAWRGTTGPILQSDMLMGEVYDARLEMPGWDRPGYHDTAWTTVRATERDTVRLEAANADPVRLTQELHPVVIREQRPGVWVVDMGQNMVGWARLRVQGRRGDQVRLRFGEMLNPDGSLYTANLRSARQTDVYILAGGGPEVWEPRFTFHGFRYVEVTGFPGRLTRDGITGCVVHSDTPMAGSWTGSHSMVNQLQKNIIWGQRGNFLSIPTDCPQRDERLGWMGDAQIFIRTASYNRDVAAFFTKWMQDVEDGQSPEGGFPNVAPRLVTPYDGAPAWGDAGVIVPWTLYLQYGDKRIIERHWAAMTRWMEYLQGGNADLLWLYRRGPDFGDWLSINADTPKDVLATAYWAYDAQLMAWMAAALGRSAEAVHYTDLSIGIKTAFNQAYVNPDGRIQGETQTVYALALMMDLLPPGIRSLAAQHLVNDIMARGGKLSTGFVGVSYLLPALTETGHVDMAYRLLLNQDFPSWGYCIQHGATTIWERWDGWTEERGFQDPGMNSFNHYAFGSVGQWLYQYAAGIDVDPQRPGYEHIIIRPYPGPGLDYVRAEYQSIRGKIVSTWRRQGTRLTLELTIPANTTATVYVPTTDARTVREGDAPDTETEGVTYMGYQAGRAVYVVRDGRYLFTAALAEE